MPFTLSSNMLCLKPLLAGGWRRWTSRGFPSLAEVNWVSLSKTLSQWLTSDINVCLFCWFHCYSLIAEQRNPMTQMQRSKHSKIKQKPSIMNFSLDIFLKKNISLTVGDLSLDGIFPLASWSKRMKQKQNSWTFHDGGQLNISKNKEFCWVIGCVFKDTARWGQRSICSKVCGVAEWMSTD